MRVLLRLDLNELSMILNGALLISCNIDNQTHCQTGILILKNLTGSPARHSAAVWRFPCEVAFRPDEITKVFGVLAVCQRAQVSQSVPEPWGQRVRPGVSLSPDVRNHGVPPLIDRSPACGAAFSLDDLHATSRRSSRRRFIRAEHLLVRSSSRERTQDWKLQSWQSMIAPDN